MSFYDRLRLALAHELQPRIQPPPDPAERYVGGNMEGDPLPNAGKAPVTLGTMAQDPRSWDYAYSSNTQYVPRAEVAFIPNFVQLMYFGLLSDNFRVASAFVWEEVLSVPVEVVYKKGSAKPKDLDKMNWLESMVECPDPLTGWDQMQWTRALGTMADQVDATTIFPVKNYAGEVIALQQVDGTTIKPLIGQKGYAPLPPYAAYEQFIHGVPYAKFSRDQLIYHPFQPRVWCPYGASPLEDMLNIVARLYLQGKWEQMKFTEGNIPQAIALMDPAAKMPGGRSATEAALDFQRALDAVAGMSAKRRRVYLMPQFIRDLKPVSADMKFDRELPEWETKWLCVRFGLPPHLFVTSSNRATAKEHGEQLVNGKHKMRLMSVERVWQKCLSAMGCDEYRVVYRRPRNFAMETVQGLIAMNQAIDPATQQPLMSREEVRAELHFEDDPDNLGLQDADLNDTADKIPELAAQEAQVVPQRPALPAPAQNPPQTAPAAPQGAAVTKAGIPAMGDRKTIGLTRKTAQLPVAQKFAKALKDALEQRKERVLKEADKRARARGLRVEG